MNLGSYLSPSTIFTDLEASDKWDLLAQVFDRLDAEGVFAEHGQQKEGAFEILSKRERLQGSGIENGIAIPHARLPHFDGLIVAMVICKTPIDFGAADKKPANVVWVLMVSEDKPAMALQAYPKIIQLMQDEGVRMYLESEKDPAKLKKYITKQHILVEGSLTARDIMRRPVIKIMPDTPLREVVHHMHTYGVEAVCVEDEQRRIVGEVTSDHLFQIGIPDFFNQLKSVGFISKFDPFEKYFSEESHATAKDVMSSAFSAMEPDATIMEVVFALTVKKYPKVYVVEEGRRIGTIDRTEVLDHILNF